MVPIKVSRFAALTLMFMILVAATRTLFASLDGGFTLLSYVSNLESINGRISKEGQDQLKQCKSKLHNNNGGGGSGGGYKKIT